MTTTNNEQKIQQISQAKPLNIVHEAESQRQHVRIQVPAFVIINNQQHQMLDLSASGLSFRSASDMPTGSIFAALIRFPFEAFKLEMQMRLQIIGNTTGAVQARFQDLTPESVSVLRHIISAYIAGEIVSANELIHVVSRDNTAKIRKTKQEKAPGIIKPLLGTACYLLIGLIALAYLIYSIYYLAAVSESLNASVSGDVVQVSMPKGGIYQDYTDQDSVDSGQTLGKYAWVKYDEDGKAVEESGLVLSPCDCYIQEKTAKSGTLVGQGQNLYKLVVKKSQPYIEASFTYPDASHFLEGDSVTFELAGDKSRKGKIEKIHAEADVVSIKVLPEEQLSTKLFGRPAIVKVDKWNMLL